MSANTSLDNDVAMTPPSGTYSRIDTTAVAYAGATPGEVLVTPLPADGGTSTCSLVAGALGWGKGTSGGASRAKLYAGYTTILNCF